MKKTTKTGQRHLYYKPWSEPQDKIVTPSFVCYLYTSTQLLLAIILV